MDVVDIVERQKELKGHTEHFALWPQLWQKYPADHALAWQLHRLSTDERQNIPVEAGIYTLLVQPGVAEHPAASYLMYVGQTNSLRRRFGKYLTGEKRETGRPLVFGGLNTYSGYVWFCFAEVPINWLDNIEDQLKNAFIPPWNKQYTGEISKVVGAWP